MIGNPNWFKNRKYTGWGISPKTWQGWVYITCLIVPFAIFNSLTIWTTQTRIIVTSIWILFLIIDTFDIMRKLKMDEREKIHEAIAERNALWGILIVIIIGIFYDIITNALEQRLYVHPFLIASLIIGLIIKSTSNIYLDKKN